MALRKRLKWPITASLVLLLVLGSVPLQAKVTGKISGVVIDAESGVPVVGATLTVAGMDLVTKTDEDGEYFIINVPVGQYDLAATHVGFEKVTQKEVRVLLDLTTPVDFSIHQAPVELANEVVVYATAPLIQRDLTSSRVIFTEDRLQNLPNINSVQAILTNYPGVVTDENNQIHVRGGRSGQLSYYYDGFSIQDPFFATAGLRIVPTALEELSLTSGGFTAEYGEALSGVVSAVTKEGGPEYRGKIRTYKGATHPYDVSTGEFGPIASVPNRSVSANFSGPIPGLNPRNYNFFSAGEYLRDDGHLPHNWYTSYSGITKFTVRPASRLKFKTNLTYNRADGAVYDHRDVNAISYDFNLDGLSVWDRESYLMGTSGHYAFSERAFLSLTFNQFYSEVMTGPAHLKGVYWSDWPGYSEDANGDYNGTIHIDNYWGSPDFSDEMEATRFTVGNDFRPSYEYRLTRYNSFSGNFVNQATKTNQIKAGFELRRYSVKWDFKQFYNSRPYGERYTSRPIQASVFLEDKLEYSDFVVNMGVRYDYRNADIAYNYTPEAETPTYRDAESKSRFSPRFGVSFPISVKSAMHFNYGIYYQVPQYRYLYTNLEGDRSSGLPLLGNPDLDPEQTISYELGLDHLIGDDLRLDVTAYYKDIEDLVTTREISRVAGQAVSGYVNDDHGTVTGFDVSLEKMAIAGPLSGSISYGYMIATGNGSNANEPYYTYLTSSTDTLAPLQEYPLDFDQRHTITMVLDYRVGSDWSGNLLGLKIPGAWGLSTVGYFGSGLPYSRVDADGNRLGERNENRLPATYSVDMRLNKDFGIGKVGHLLTVFVEVDNVFNRRNVLNVYARTGLPDDDANRADAGLALDQDEIDKYDRLMDLDPQNYSPPRTIRTGLEFSF